MKHKHTSTNTIIHNVFVINKNSDMNDAYEIVNNSFPNVSDDTELWFETESISDSNGDLVSFRVEITPKG